jgi:hypothetical protein
MTTACKVTWAGFLRSGEFTYSLKDQPGSHDFINTKLTRSDITFDECYEYAILRLKRSKTDTNHKGIGIILAATQLASQTISVRQAAPYSSPLPFELGSL